VCVCWLGSENIIESFIHVVIKLKREKNIAIAITIFVPLLVIRVAVGSKWRQIQPVISQNTIQSTGRKKLEYASTSYGKYLNRDRI
jgi:hypothetical protein